MNGRFEAIVIGAGPAGSAAAAHLARAGVTVLLIDREQFPRDKACGGGLTPRGVGALERLGVDTSDGFVRVTGLHMSAGKHQLSASFPSTSKWPSHGLVARRNVLDQKVLDAAIRAGVEFRPGVRVAGPLIENGACIGVRVGANGPQEDLHAPVTIAADGATSVVARGAGLADDVASKRGFWYTALRGYFREVQPVTRDGDALLEFYPLRTKSGRYLPAYGWVFPLPDGTANVGVDIPHSPKLAPVRPLREAYNEFIALLRRERDGFADAVEEAPPVGALLPEAMRGFRPAMPGLLAVGDAAGMITPYSGEGIAYALEGAEIAAAAITSGKSPADVAHDYAMRLRNDYGFHFTWSLRFMKAMRRGPLARMSAAVGLRSPRVLRAAVRIMAYLIEDDASAPPSTVSRAYLWWQKRFPVGH